MLRQHGGLAPFQRLGGRVPVAPGGTEHFCPQKLGCPQCLTRQRANGRVESYHAISGKPLGLTLFAAMNLLAFAIHTVCDCLEQAWTGAWAAKRARKRFFEHVRTTTAYLVFPGWQTLMQTLIASKPPPDIAAQTAM